MHWPLVLTVLGYIKAGIEYDLSEILVRLLCGMIVEAGHVMSALQQIPLKVLQPHPVTGRWEGTHKQYSIGVSIESADG